MGGGVAWKAAGVFGALREGISETLVLLAVHGNHLFKTRLGFDGEVAASRLVMELLEPLSTRKIEANERDLPVYAEAAPDTFLKIFERDLKTEQPASISILKSIEGDCSDFIVRASGCCGRWKGWLGTRQHWRARS